MTKYYLALGGVTPQVCTLEEIQSLIRLGQAGPETKACEVGAQKWSALKDLFPHLFANFAPPPPLPPPPVAAGPASAPAEASLGKAGKAFGQISAEFASLAVLFFKRILIRNFTVAHASDEERRALESAPVPIRSIIAQNYTAWRRAMLWFSGIGLAVATVSFLIGFFKNQVGGDMPGIMTFINWSIVVFRVAGPVLAIMAAVRWLEVQKSRRLAWLGWLIQFLGPIVLLMIPVRHLISKDFGEGFDIGSAIGLALASLILIVPLIFGLFPGIIRAGLTVRTLIPESPLPGWICAVIAPIFALMMSALLIITLQLGGGAIILAMILLTAVPIIVALDVKNLSKPQNADAMNLQMTKLRRRISIVAGFGLAFLFIAAYDLISTVGFWDLFSTLCSFLGNLFLVTLIASDLLISLMRLAHEQDKALQASPLFTHMDERFRDLAQMRLVGFTEPAAPAGADETVVLRP